jgi:hypothetical protein
MNNDFNSWYLALLRKQVEEEIQFLVTNGHDNTFVTTRCMFCVQHHSGKFHCRRLKDLREFQSSIMSHIRANATDKGRQKIGYEALHQLDLNSDTPVFQIK